VLLNHRQLTLRGKPRRQAHTLSQAARRLALILLVDLDELRIVDKVPTLTTEKMAMREILVDVVAVLVKVIGDVSATAERDAVEAAEEVAGGGADKTKTV